jgi:hypothetical protein
MVGVGGPPPYVKVPGTMISGSASQLSEEVYHITARSLEENKTATILSRVAIAKIAKKWLVTSIRKPLVQNTGL